MRVPFLDLNAQTAEVRIQLDEAIAEILDNSAFVLGKWGKRLEETLAAAHGVKHGIAVNSGTDALKIALQASGIGPGDEVITTAFTFVASVEVIAQLGATPVFVDIDAATFNIDPEKVEAAITSRTKAIMPIHLFGQLCDIRAIMKIADSHGLVVIEDAAQSLLSHHNERYAGAFGKAAGISFYVTKNLGAAGDGGLILTNDDKIKEQSLSLRIHGMGKERYYYDHLGYTSRMAEIQAAVLCEKWDRLADWNRRRVVIANTYIKELEGTPVVTPITAEGNNHTWHQFTVRSDRRDDLMNHLRSREVDCSIFYPVPLHLHDPYRAYGAGEGSLPVTELACRQVLSLPVHPHLSDDQVRFAAGQIKEFCARAAAAR
jgi:dTDP-4-amino-4,6-dideoxygalactose transaminase